MKTKILLLALAAAAVAPLTARAETEVSLEFFYDNLSPYGEWIEVGDYGTCWRPSNIDDEWSPYTDGYWSYTDAGWTWISYEDFGDICYHYGRWVRTDDVGWCWVPDYEWGPAWVSWRKSDDYIGWAPLPPEARWRPSVGFSVWVDDYCDIGPSYYNFCPVVDFGAPVIRPVCLPRSRTISIFGGTVNITNITYNSYGRHVFCGGPDFFHINRHVRRPIPTLKLVQNTTIINNNVTVINNRKVIRAPRNRVAGNTLQVFAPRVVHKPAQNLPKPPIAKVLSKPKVDKGWAMVGDPGERQRLRQKVKTETKGLNPDTAPAKPVQVADLKPLPERPDTNAPSPVQVGPGRGKPGTGRGDRPGAPVATVPGAGVPPRGDRGDKKAQSGATVPQTPGIVGQPVPGRGGSDKDRPGKRGRDDDRPNVPGQVAVVPGEKPAVMPTEPGRPQQPGRGERPDKKQPERPTIPGAPSAPGIPGRKPFREQPPVAQTPATNVPDGRNGGGRGNSLAEQQRQQQMRQAQQEQQRQLESRKQLERQQNAQEELMRQRKAQSDAAQREAAARKQAENAQRQAAMQRQAESAQRESAARKQAEAQQRQAAMQQQQQAAQRQAAQQQAAQRQAMQRQAEMQQRQQQALRQQQMQRQMQQQRQVQPQRQMQAPRQQPQQFVPRQQGSGRGGGGQGRGSQLSPEQIEAMKGRRGR